MRFDCFIQNVVVSHIDVFEILEKQRSYKDNHFSKVHVDLVNVDES